jgi:outer membrane protein assembly factor BamB
MLILCLTLAVAGGGYLASRSPWVRGLFAHNSENAAEIAKLAEKKLDLAPVAAPEMGWPQWRGPTRDGRAPAGPLRTDWDKSPPKLLWKSDGGGGYGSCAVVGARVYTQYRKDGRDILQCLDAATGSLRWEVGDAANYDGTDPTYAIGPRATPTIEGKLIWTVDGAGHLRCYRSREPEGQGLDALWHVDLIKMFDAKLPHWGAACSPLIEGDLVIVQPGGKDGSVVALDKTTGETRWSAGQNPPSYSSPVAATIGGQRMIFALTGDALLAIRASDGAITDSYSWKTVPEVNVVTPLVVDDYVFISSAYGMGCALLRAEAKGDVVKLVSVYARRRPPGMQNHFSTSVFKDRHLFGFDGMGAARLKCVEFDTGKEKADWDAETALAKGTLILAGNHLIIQTERGELGLVEATPDEFRLIARIPKVLSGKNNWATPSLVEGRLYLRDEEKVVCYDVRP